MTVLKPCDTSESMPSTLCWGIIGTGGIAGDFATAMQKMDGCEVVSAVGSSPGRSKPFAEKFGLPHAADTLDELLADDTVDAVYIATPHPMHERHALAAIAAGKHVLCEKPLTVDAAATERVIAEANSGGVFLMEAFMYRCHPLTAKLVELIRSGEIGKVLHIDADFGFYMKRDPKHRLFNPDLAGGGILDVGGYPVSFARLIAGVAVGKDFDEPTRVHAAGQLGPTGVDEFAQADLLFPTGITARVRAAIQQDLGTATTITGTLGSIHLPNPWIPQSGRHGLTTSFTVRRPGKADRVVSVTTELAVYAIEARVAADAIARGQTQPPAPAMQWADTLGNMRVLDPWREQLGVVVATR